MDFHQAKELQLPLPPLEEQAIYLSHLKELELPLPDINSQKEFVALYAAVISNLGRYRVSLQGMEDLFSSLAQQAFRGELNKQTEAA